MTYNIENFNAEMDRISLNVLLGLPVNLSNLREIYKSLLIIEDNFQYDEKDSDTEFWQKCQKYRNFLVKQS